MVQYNSFCNLNKLFCILKAYSKHTSFRLYYCIGSVQLCIQVQFSHGHLLSVRGMMTVGFTRPNHGNRCHANVISDTDFPNHKQVRQNLSEDVFGI